MSCYIGQVGPQWGHILDKLPSDLVILFHWLHLTDGEISKSSLNVAVFKVCRKQQNARACH